MSDARFDLIVIGSGPAGALGAVLFRQVAAGYIRPAELPGMPPLAGAAAVLLAGGVVAALMPAVRAAHVDVLEALRSE